MLCIHYSQLFTGISRFLSGLTCELRKQDGHPANEAAGCILTRSHPLKTCPSPKSLHPAWPQGRAVPSMSALTTCPQVGRLFPLHANLELPMNTSTPWILIHKASFIKILLLLLLSHVSLGSYQFLSLPLTYLALAKLLCLESKFPPMSAGVSIITLSSVFKVGHLFKSTALYS